MKYFSSPEDRDQAFKLIGQGWLPGANAGSVVRTRDGRAGWADPTVWLAMTEIISREAARPQPQEARPALQSQGAGG